MTALVRLALLGAAVVVLTAVTPMLFEFWREPAFVAAGIATGLITLLAARVARDAPEKAALAIVLVVAAVTRMVALAEPPLLSTDVYRYVWDGRVQGAGLNPYRWVPADPALAFLRDAEVYPNINRADYAHTAYPPFAQVVFFLATRFGDGVDAIRIAFVAGEAVVVMLLTVLLARLGRSRAGVVAYAWHPLAIWEIANAGHVDAVVALVVTGAVTALLLGRRVLGAVLTACAVLTKPYAFAVLPAFWRPFEWRAPLLVLVVVAALYAPYLGVGTEVIGFVPGYLREEGFVAGGGFWPVALARYLGGDLPGLVEIHLGLAAIVFSAMVLRILRRPAIYEPDRQIRDVAGLLVLGLFALSPNYPWYYLPLVPFVVLTGGGVVWTITLLAPVLHVEWPGSEDPATRFLVWKSVLNGGFIAVALAGFALRRAASAWSHRSSAGPAAPLVSPTRSPVRS